MRRRASTWLACGLILAGCDSGIFDNPRSGCPACENDADACVPATCGTRCGSVDDGCGGLLTCSPCAGDPGAPDASESGDAGAQACAGQPRGTWTFETADAAGDTGSFPSIVVDSDGVVHVAYYDTSIALLRYARRSTAGQWVTSSVTGVGSAGSSMAGNLGAGTSIQLDESSSPTIAYYDLTNRDLSIARREGSGWTSDSVDTAGDVGGWPSLVLIEGSAHVTYHDRTNRAFKAAHRIAPGTWTFEVVYAFFGGWQSALVADANGGLHVTYSEAQNHLGYAYAPPGGTFQSTRIDGSQGLWSSIAIDALGGRHVAYCSSMTNGELRLASRPGTDWSVEVVDTSETSIIGWSAALGIDASGTLHLAYIHQSNGELRYARRGSSGGWTIATLDTPGTPPDLGRYVALALDRGGVVHLAYYDRRTADLRYARRCP